MKMDLMDLPEELITSVFDALPLNAKLPASGACKDWRQRLGDGIFTVGLLTRVNENSPPDASVNWGEVWQKSGKSREASSVEIEVDAKEEPSESVADLVPEAYRRNYKVTTLVCRASGVPMKHLSLSDLSLFSMAHSKYKIVSIDVGGLHSLETVDLSGCQDLDSVRVPPVTSLDLSGCKNLRSVHINRHLKGAGGDPGSSTPAALVSLNLCHCAKLSAASLRELFPGPEHAAAGPCAAVETLCIDWMLQLGGALGGGAGPSPAEVVASCPKLARVLMRGVADDAALFSLARRAPPVTQVNIAFSSEVSDWAVEQLMSSPAGAGLRDVNVRGCRGLSKPCLSRVGEAVWRRRAPAPVASAA